MFYFAGDFLTVGIDHRKTGGLVHQGALEGVFLADCEVLVNNRICKCDRTFCKRHVDIVLAKKRGANLRQGYCLLLVIDILMCCNQIRGVHQTLIGDERLTAKLVCVKLIVHIDRTVRGVWRERHSSGDRVIVAVFDCFAGILIHQRTYNNIGSAGNQIFITNRINDCHTSFGRELMASVLVMRQSPNARECDGLCLIPDILMACDNNVIVEHGFEHDKRFARHVTCIQGESHLDRAVRCACNEGCLRSNGASGCIQSRFASTLVVQSAAHCVLLAYQQVLIAHSINDHKIAVCIEFLVSVLVGSNRPNLRSHDSLVLIREIFMNSDNAIFIAHAFKRDHRCSSQI